MLDSCVEAEAELAPALSNVGLREPLSTLAAEFKFNASFAAKVQDLERRGYVGWRRVRGDGNCFYRAVGFGALELIASRPAAERELLAAALRKRLEELPPPEDDEGLAALEGLLTRVARLGEAGVWEDSAASPSGTLSCMPAPKGAAALESLHRSFNDPHRRVDAAMISCLRRLAAQRLLANASDDEATGCGISYETICTSQGFQSVEDFCQRVVLPEGTEAESLVMSALPVALGIRLRIAFLDRLEASEVPFCDFGQGADDGASESVPEVHLQLRPGHYDLLYFGAGLDPCGV